MAADEPPMPRPRRRRFPIRAASTPLLLVLTLGLSLLWVRSYCACDVVALFTPGGHVQMAGAHRGTFIVVLTDLSFGDESGPGIEFGTTSPEALERDRERLSEAATYEKKGWGFGYARGAVGLRVLTSRYWAAHAPAWAVVTPLWIPLVIRLARPLRALRRRRRGLCPACGYDLRGTPGADRCPECGHAAANAPPVATAPAAV